MNVLNGHITINTDPLFPHVSKILVVGMGISGSSIARMIADRTGDHVVIIDKGDSIGGNCYDYRDENGIMIHKYGSHIFHTSNKDVWDFLSKYTSFNTYMHRVYALIEGNEVPIPFNFDSIRRCFPETLAKRIEEKLLAVRGYGSKIPIRDFMQQDDEDLRFLAQYVYDNVFVHYTEKQWGKDPSQIDGAVTARVPVYLSRDCRYFQDRFQGIPSEGYTAMIEKMLDSPLIEKRFNTDFKDVPDKESYDHILYTGPIDELMDYRFGPLPYRSVHFRMETYDREHYQSNAVINYPNNYDFTRIHEYKYYLNDRSDKTVIAKEYSEDFVIGKNERYYPVPTDETAVLYQKYLEAAEKELPNISFLGRLGDYKYYDMDKAVARAMDIFNTLFGQKNE